MRSFVSILIAAIVVGTSAQAADPLALFEGAWTGNGEGRASAADPWQPASCQMDADFIDRSATLRTTGRCRGGGANFPTIGTLRAGDASGTFSALAGYGVNVVSSVVTITAEGIIVVTVYDAQEEGTATARQVVSWPNGAGFTMTVQILNVSTGRFVDYSRMTFTAAD